ncbi:MAG: hypothetical protein GY824_14260 [Delftia sp.]|nr:hypothetical protein [Delftia sp.]
MRYLVERVFGLPTDLAPDVKKANQARWEAGIQANAALREFLEARTVNDQPLDWRDISRPTYKALLRYATKPSLGLDAQGQPLIQPQEQGRYVALLARVNAFDRLVKLRHRTIIGHGFEGVSEALILENYKGSEIGKGQRRAPVQGMAEVLNMLRLDVQSNPYQAVAEFVISGLRE